jgi:hypothetical protein
MIGERRPRQNLDHSARVSYATERSGMSPERRVNWRSD